MSDVNANIGVHIDTSAALAELKNLQRQIATFHSQVSKSSATAAMAQKNLQTNLLNSINATGKFHAQMGVVRTSTESFTNALEKNKLSMRDYFRYAGGASKSFGKLFKSEFDTIGKVAEERVKKMQTQYIKMGRDASGAMRAMSITPNTLNMQDYATKTALAAQKQALFNQLVKQGSTNLLNFGKNTQWAGRQLMVGFSVPLLYIGGAASKVFMDLEQQALKFKRVYGDMFTTSDETNKALKDIELLAKEFTKYGVAVSKTMEMAASAAAMGQTGAELTAQVAQATRLAVLGNVEQEQALETTISLTSAFGIAAEDLAKKIDFLNSVENQTIVSIEDLTIAVPKAGPVVKQLGGDVEDLAFFLTAMKEGGINASEGANALKSGLASLINPSKKAAAMLNDYGVNIKAIVEGNQGDIKSTVIEFAQALDTLAPLDRSRAIEQLFGKFQFARLSTLFQNITKEGTQANRVLELSKMEVEELAIISERELKTIENAVGTNFKEAVESLKLTIAPIGKTFLEAVTPIVKAVAGILEKFNGLSDGTKKFIVVASTLVGIIGPTLLMTFGLVANGAANIIKLFLALRTGYLKLGGNTKILANQTSYMNSEQLEAATVAASLNQAHTKLTQSFVLETSAVNALRNAYVSATVAATNFAVANPGMMRPGAKGTAPKKFARGTTSVPGTGNKDTVPSVLTPGEAVIPAPVAQDPRFQPIIDAMVNGKLQGFNEGTVFAHAVDKRVVTGSNMPESMKSLGFGSANAFSAIGFDLSAETNSRLVSGNVPVSKYLAELNAPGSTTTMTARLIDLGVSPREAARVTETMKNNLAKSLVTMPPNQLIGDKQIYSRMGNLSTGILGGIVRKSNGGVFGNAVKSLYAGTTFSPLGSSSVKMNSTAPISSVIESARKTKTSQSAINALVNLQKVDPNYKLPVQLDSSGNIIAYERPEVSKKTGQISSTRTLAVLDGDRFRTGRIGRGGGRKLTPSKKAMESARTALAVARGEVLETKDGKQKTVTGQTGTAKPSGRNITDSPRDTRIISKNNVRRVFPYGMKGPRIAGAIDGYDEKGKLGFNRGLGSDKTPKIVQENIDATEKQTKEIKASSVATKENITQSKLSKESIKNFGAKANLGVGALSGLTIAASFAGGKVGEMAQKIMPFIFGLQGVLMLLPLLMNPLVGIPLALGAVVAGIWLFNKKQNDAIKAEAKLVDELFATTKKMQQVGEMSGKVGASQLAARKRESSGGDFSFERKGIKFGSAFLQSEVGKADIAAFETRFKAMPDIAMKEFSLKLASYVSDGVIDAAQAASIADQVGIEFQNKVLGIKIQGQLQGLLTSDGKDITQEPFEIRVKIAEETISQFDNLVPNLQDQLDTAEKQKNELKTKFSLALADEASGRITPEESRAIEQEFRDAEKRVASIKNSIKQNSAFASGMASQAYEAIQAQVDGIEVSTLKTLDKLKAEKAATKDLEKQALIQKQIDAIELKRTTSLNKLRAMNDRVTKGIEQQLKLSSSGEKQAFFTGSAEAVRSRFKGTKQEGDANLLLAKTAQMGQSVVRAKIEAVVSSGQFGPGQASGFINLFGNDQATLNKTLNTFLNVQGIDDLNKLQSILGTFEDQELAKDIMINMSGLTDKEFQAQYSTLELLMQMDNEEINVELVLKDPGALAKITSINTAIENIPDVTQKSVELVLTEKGFSAGGLAEISANWEYFAGLPSNLRKTALQTFTTLHATIFASNESKQEWARQQAEAAAGRAPGAMKDLAQQITYTTLIDAKTGGFTEEGNKAVAKDVLAQTKDIIGIQAMIDKMLNPKGGGGSSGGTRNTFLDSILDKLRRTRDASVDTTKGLEELRRVIKDSGGDIQVFNGLDQAISKLKAPQEFIDFIASLDPKGKKGGIESLATYLDTEKLKKGIVELTKDGKILLSVFREGVIGDFESDLRKSTNGLIAQKEQFILLNLTVKDNKKSAEMLADANFALALSSATTTAEVNRLVAAWEAADKAKRDYAATSDPLADLQNQFSEVEDRVNDFFSLAQTEIEGRYARKIFDAEAKVKAAQDQVDIAQEEVSKVQKDIDKIQTSIDSKQRDIQEFVTRPIEKFQEDISAIEETIRTTFDIPIAALQEESSDLANDLTIIDRAADEINKKYDLQAEALDKISEINQEIISQDKKRISLADALSSGDISAAAQAIQDIRQGSAGAASKSNRDLLDLAKKEELKNIEAARLAIQDRQFVISQLIYNLEEGREIREAEIALIKETKILPLERERERISKLIRADEDKIFEITKNKLIPAQQALDIAIEALDKEQKIVAALEKERKAELTHLEGLKLKWTEVQGNIALAKLETINLQDEITKAIDLAKLLAKEFGKIAVPGGGVSGMPVAPDLTQYVAPEDDAESIAASDEFIAIVKALDSAQAAFDAGTGGGHGADAKYDRLQARLAAAQAAYDATLPAIDLNSVGGGGGRNFMTLASGGMVMPKYFAAGGYSRGTDTVPAMLTPGEFVMSKYAVSSYGLDKMNAINSGTYEGEKVYNYNLSVNVKSDSNPDDIARVVIKQIQQLDNQRVRKQAN